MPRNELLPSAMATGTVELSTQQETSLLVEEARDDLLLYTCACDPNYIISKMHVLLAKTLEEVYRKKSKRVIITIPPRVGKSRLACIEFPTWLLGNEPKAEVVVAAYAKDIALTHSRAARQRMQDETYQAIFDTAIQEGDGRSDDWGTTGGGKYRAVGVEGALTGRGADYLICDDLIRDFAAAHSQVTLDTIWNWFWSVAYTRLSPTGSVIVIMTRWSRGDIVGRLTDPARKEEMRLAGCEEEWEVINLPALTETATDCINDRLNRGVNESVCPERFSAQRYASIRASIGSYIWSALYRGEPVIRGGNYIQVDKLQTIRPENVPDIRWIQAWDLATSEKKSADYTVGGEMGIDKDGKVYIRNVQRGQWAWPKARERICALARMGKPIRVGVEVVGGFKTAFANLAEVFPREVGLSEFSVDADKLTRALPWIAKVEKGDVYLVAGDWNMLFFAELEAFPNGQNDDCVDFVSLGYHMLTQGTFIPVNIGSSDKFGSAMRSRRERTLVG